MNTMLIRTYYTVRILGPRNTNVSEDPVVPASWIKWQHEGCPTVLLALPNESKEITKKRVERYENPTDNWNLYCAEVMKSTYSYAVDDNDTLPLDLSLRPSKTNKNLITPRTADGQGHNENNQYGIASGTPTNSTDSAQKWTLKHQKFAPGLVELMPNTRVYIGRVELHKHLQVSTKCTQLGRLLIKDIFTEAALKQCLYVGNRRGRQDLRLDANATTTIIEFVLKQGHTENWHQSTEESVRAAINYQLGLERQKIN